MTKPHLHKADLSPHRATDMRCLPKYQYFLRLSGCSFTNAHKYAAQEVAFHSYSVKKCKANNIVGSGLRHQNPERPDHPTGVSSSQVEPAHKQLLGCATPTMVFVQTCAGAENQAKMLHVLGNAVPKDTGSEVPSEDNEKGGKCPRSCSTHAKRSFLPVSQGLSEDNPSL